MSTPWIEEGHPASMAATATEADWLAPVYVLPRPTLVEGQGAWVRDAAGKRYLDFVSGIAANSLGHAHPGLRRAVTRQMAKLVHVSNYFSNPPAAAVARRLVEITGYDRVFLCNSGTEAVEAALKFARAASRANGRPGAPIIAFEGAFHGRSAFALAVTASPAYREPFEPLVPGIRFAPFNDQAGFEAIVADTAPGAIIVEPVQGEAGAVPATPEFLNHLRQRADELGALLLFDEVQCGVGRSGRFLAAESFGVRADITILAKGLGGGVPVGAVLMNDAVARALKPGMHGTTFGGNALAAAAACYVLDTVARPGFLARVRQRSVQLLAGLGSLVARHPSLTGARGLGLLTAVEVAADAPFDAAGLVEAAREAGLLIVRGGARAVRLLPPLNVSRVEISEALARLESALRALEQKGIDR